MRDFIYSLMTDRRNGAIFVPFKFILYIASLLYGLGIFIRAFLYRASLFRTKRPPLKIISIGNLTLGGTGKTPFATTLARILKDEMGKEAVILMRGYGWDEQAMLKKNLPDIPVFAGEDRTRSADKSIKLYGSDTAVLDDGFQHWELARDLDIVLIDSRNPFGNGRLFPRGILREPKKAVKRADMVVFTKVNKKAADIEALKKDLKDINGGLVFLEAVHSPRYLYDAKSGKRYDLIFAKGRNVMLLSSIGDPRYFEETMNDLGANVIEHIVFGDHHNYRARDVESIVRRCDERSFDLLVTTEKDAVKLGRMHLSFGRYNPMTLVVQMEIIAGREALIAGLHSLYNSPHLK